MGQACDEAPRFHGGRRAPTPTLPQRGRERCIGVYPGPTARYSARTKSDCVIIPASRFSASMIGMW